MHRRIARVAAALLLTGAAGITAATGAQADTPQATAAACSLLQRLLGGCKPPPPPPVTVPTAPSLPVVDPPVPPLANPAGLSPAWVNHPAAADQLLALVNAERQAAGLAPLTMSASAVGVATEHSLDMARSGTVFHNPNLFTALTRSLLGGGSLGENVVRTAVVEDAHGAFMASPGHRGNIMNPAFRTAGFAVVPDDAGVLYVTEDFATGKGGGAVRTPAAAPRPTATPSRSARPAPAPKPVAVRTTPAPSAPAPVTTTTTTAPAPEPVATPMAIASPAGPVVVTPAATTKVPDPQRGAEAQVLVIAMLIGATAFIVYDRRRLGRN